MKLLKDKFAISTYETDYILVKDKDASQAIDALTTEKYEIIEKEV